MKDYKKAYEIIVNRQLYLSGGIVLNAEKLILELVDKEIELESRKDKLVVGSEWECVLHCYGEHWSYNQNYMAIIKKIGTDYSNYVEISSGTTEDNMPTDQFLLCFKPR